MENSNGSKIRDLLLVPCTPIDPSWSVTPCSRKLKIVPLLAHIVDKEEEHCTTLD